MADVKTAGALFTAPMSEKSLKKINQYVSGSYSAKVGDNIKMVGAGAVNLPEGEEGDEITVHTADFIGSTVSYQSTVFNLEKDIQVLFFKRNTEWLQSVIGGDFRFMKHTRA